MSKLSLSAEQALTIAEAIDGYGHTVGMVEIESCAPVSAGAVRISFHDLPGEEKRHEFVVSLDGRIRETEVSE